MADDDLIALDKSKSSNPKPIPKPGSLKPAGSSKKNSKDYKSLTGRQKAAIFLISLGPDVSSEIMKHLREDHDLTQTQVAKIINKSQQGYNHIEVGRAELKIEDLAKLCEFYNVSADYFICLTNEPKPLK